MTNNWDNMNKNILNLFLMRKSDKGTFHAICTCIQNVKL